MKFPNPVARLVFEQRDGGEIVSVHGNIKLSGYLYSR